MNFELGEAEGISKDLEKAASKARKNNNVGVASVCERTLEKIKAVVPALEGCNQLQQMNVAHDLGQYKRLFCYVLFIV